MTWTPVYTTKKRALKIRGEWNYGFKSFSLGFMITKKQLTIYLGFIYFGIGWRL